MANNQVAWGFETQKHLFNQRTLLVNEQILRKAIDDSMMAHNAVIKQLISSVAEFTTKVKWKMKTRNFYEMQTVDEYGRPKVVKQQARYDMALPIEQTSTAFGFTDIARAKMTVEELNDEVVSVSAADLDWLKRHLMAAWLTKDSYTVDDEENGTLTIKPLANGDTDVYVDRNGKPFTTNHYLAQNSSISDANNPFPLIYDTLDKHKSNSGRYVAYVATNLVASIEAMTAFYPVKDPDLQYSANVTTLASAGGQPNSNVTQKGGALARFGDEYLGKVGKVHIVEWSSLPDSYIVAHAEGAGAFIGIREETVPELQGLYPKYDNSDTRLTINEFYRIAGFGIVNREAALAMLIGSGSYANPTNYTAPLVN